MKSYLDYLRKPRHEICIDRVFSYMATHRRTIVTRIDVERHENIYRILVHHMNTRTNKHNFIPLSFYRGCEEDEAKAFIDAISSEFDVTVNDNPFE